MNLLRIWIVVMLVAPAATGQLAERKPVLPLSLKQAVDLALAPEGNVRVQLAEELVREAAARSAEARSALLPHFDSSVGQQNLTRNLAAFGVRLQTPLPGIVIPEVVGPFNTFDARATATQTMLDFSAIRRWQASRGSIGAAEQEAESRRDQTAAQVARLYLAAMKAEAALEAARAAVALAEALARLATNQKDAGTGTAIEVTRAEVQRANERQRSLIAEEERRRAHLELLKAMGMKLHTAVELTDRLSYQKVEIPPVEEAVRTALETRADLKAQRGREETARLSDSATKWERLPSVHGFADYGSIGSSLNHALPTRAYGVSVRVPVFDGGRREARRAESASQLRQERLRSEDLRQQAELEIRLAIDSLRSADEQVKVAEEGLALAERELAQAERRYRAGVSNSLEVTDAQSRLERARQNRIAALASHRMAGLDLGQAMGIIRTVIR